MNCIAWIKKDYLDIAISHYRSALALNEIYERTGDIRQLSYACKHLYCTLTILLYSFVSCDKILRSNPESLSSLLDTIEHDTYDLPLGLNTKKLLFDNEEVIVNMKSIDMDSDIISFVKHSFAGICSLAELMFKDLGYEDCNNLLGK